MSAVVTGLATRMITSIQANPIIWLSVFGLGLTGFGCYHYLPGWVMNKLRSWYDWFIGLTRGGQEKVFEGFKELTKQVGLDALIPVIQAGQDALGMGLDLMSSPAVRDAFISVFIVWLILRLLKR